MDEKKKGRAEETVAVSAGGRWTRDAARARLDELQQRYPAPAAAAAPYAAMDVDLPAAAAIPVPAPEAKRGPKRKANDTNSAWTRGSRDSCADLWERSHRFVAGLAKAVSYEVRSALEAPSDDALQTLVRDESLDIIAERLLDFAVEALMDAATAPQGPNKAALLLQRLLWPDTLVAPYQPAEEGHRAEEERAPAASPADPPNGPRAWATPNSADVRMDVRGGPVQRAADWVAMVGAVLWRAHGHRLPAEEVGLEPPELFAATWGRAAARGLLPGVLRQRFVHVMAMVARRWPSGRGGRLGWAVPSFIDLAFWSGTGSLGRPAQFTPLLFSSKVPHETWEFFRLSNFPHVPLSAEHEQLLARILSCATLLPSEHLSLLGWHLHTAAGGAAPRSKRPPFEAADSLRTESEQRSPSTLALLIFVRCLFLAEPSSSSSSSARPAELTGPQWLELLARLLELPEEHGGLLGGEFGAFEEPSVWEASGRSPPVRVTLPPSPPPSVRRLDGAAPQVHRVFESEASTTRAPLAGGRMPPCHDGWVLPTAAHWRFWSARPLAFHAFCRLFGPPSPTFLGSENARSGKPNGAVVDWSFADMYRVSYSSAFLANVTTPADRAAQKRAQDSCAEQKPAQDDGAEREEVQLLSAEAWKNAAARALWYSIAAFTPLDPDVPQFLSGCQRGCGRCARCHVRSAGWRAATAAFRAELDCRLLPELASIVLAFAAHLPKSAAANANPHTERE